MKKKYLLLVLLTFCTKSQALRVAHNMVDSSFFDELETNVENKMRNFMEEIDKMKKSANKMFSSMTGKLPEDINIYEKDNNVGIEINLPGFEKKDIKIKLDTKKGILHISAKTKKEESEKEEKKEDENGRVYIYKSSSSSAEKSFSRTINLNKLPTAVRYEDKKEIKAKYEKSLLRIEFPKKKEEDKNKEDMYIELED